MLPSGSTSGLSLERTDSWSTRWRRQEPYSHTFQREGSTASAAARRLHDLGVMVNGTLVFGMDDDDETVFDRTVDWAIAQGIEMATFHILTRYPGTMLRQRLMAQGRILHNDWDRYDTRHAVFQPSRMTPEALEAGYWRSYLDLPDWDAAPHDFRRMQASRSNPWG